MNKYLSILVVYALLYIIPGLLLIADAHGWYSKAGKYYGLCMIIVGVMVILKRLIEARHFINYKKDNSLKKYRDAKSMDREESASAN